MGGYMRLYGWIWLGGVVLVMEHPLCKRRHEKCFLPKFMVSNFFCVLLEIIKLNQWSMGSCQQSTCIIGHVHSLKPNSKFFVAENRPETPKRKGSSSNHPFSGAFAVSFREGMIRNGSPWGAQLRGHRFPMVHNVMVPVEMWRFLLGPNPLLKGS